MDNNNKSIVIGIVGHISPEHLPEFKQIIENYPFFRIIRVEESNNKLWIVSQEGYSGI